MVLQFLASVKGSQFASVGLVGKGRYDEISVEYSMEPQGCVWFRQLRTSIRQEHNPSVKGDSKSCSIGAITYGVKTEDGKNPLVEQNAT